MTTGMLTLSQTQEAAGPWGNLLKSMEKGGGRKKNQHSGNSTHLNIMFIYSTTEEKLDCHTVGVCVRAHTRVCLFVCKGRLNALKPEIKTHFCIQVISCI